MEKEVLEARTNAINKIVDGVIIKSLKELNQNNIILERFDSVTSSFKSEDDVHYTTYKFKNQIDDSSFYLLVKYSIEDENFYAETISEDCSDDVSFDDILEASSYEDIDSGVEDGDTDAILYVLVRLVNKEIERRFNNKK